VVADPEQRCRRRRWRAFLRSPTLASYKVPEQVGCAPNPPPPANRQRQGHEAGPRRQWEKHFIEEYRPLDPRRSPTRLDDSQLPRRPSVTERQSPLPTPPTRVCRLARASPSVVDHRDKRTSFRPSHRPNARRRGVRPRMSRPPSEVRPELDRPRRIRVLRRPRTDASPPSTSTRRAANDPADRGAQSQLRVRVGHFGSRTAPASRDGVRVPRPRPRHTGPRAG